MTDEPAELVVPWMEKHGVTHPVVIMPNKELEKVIGVRGFPSSAVFLGREMQWTGHPSSSASALAAARKKGSKDSIYPKKFSKVIKSYNKKEFVKAMLDLRKSLEKVEGDDLTWGKQFEQFLLDSSAKAFKAADQAIQDGFWLQGIEIAEPYLGKGSPYPMVEETVAKFESLKEDKLYSKEMSGGKLYAKAKGYEDAKEYVDAVKTYKSILKRCAGTQIATHAQTAGQKLIDDRRPGHKPNCPSCRRARGAACSKHHEEMEL
ncbi:MAG: hypothetical protein QF489_02700 [Planctomycetota bacterium]|nr:hypothetical protein [Planctomycetota bacterium]